MAQLPEDTMQGLFALREQLQAAPPKDSSRTRLVKGFARQHGCFPGTVYRWLSEHAGWASGRKRRADAGSTKLPTETLEFIAASVLQSVRANGISTKPICVAMNIAHENGLDVNVSASRVASLLRAHRMDVKTQANTRNHQRLRSLHPNHVHQIDPSLCLLYYMGGKQHMLDEKSFYKNKALEVAARVKLRVLRYVRYDHASRSIDLRYFEAAGENQELMFEFLLHTWGRHPMRLSHGVSHVLLWDKGSANTGAGVVRLLDALGVDHRTHARHHPWVKGGVENANWIVERHFESRLRDEPVDSIEELNASAEAWVRDYNANAIALIDSRVEADNGEHYVRDDLWSLINHYPGALIEMPPREACAWFMRGKDEQRVVRNGHVTFAHPQSGRSELYNLQPWARHFANGQKVRVSPLLLGDCMLRVEFDRIGEEALHADVAPERNFDSFGRPLSATVLGEEYRSAPHTAAQEAAKRIAQVAYGDGTSLDDAERLKDDNARPFQYLNGGRGVVAHSHLGKAELPHRLTPEAVPLETAALQAARSAQAIAMLSAVDAMLRIVGAIGRHLTPEEHAFMAQRYAAGVPEDQLDALIAQFQAGPAEGAPQRAAGGLRAV